MRRIGAMLSAAVLTLGVVAATAGAGPDRPRSVAVAAGGEQVRATQGSWCYFGPRVGMCADYGYPLRVKDRLAVAPGERVTFRLHDRSIKNLSADLLRVRDREIDYGDPLEDIERVPGNPRAWRATIPADAGNANRISIFVRYKRNAGDSNWWAGIRLGE